MREVSVAGRCEDLVDPRQALHPAAIGHMLAHRLWPQVCNPPVMPKPVLHVDQPLAGC